MSKQWVAILSRYDRANTCSTHLVMQFTYAEKLKNKKFDCYSKHFELHFQATIPGVDPLRPTTQMDPSEWYAPRLQNVNIDNFFSKRCAKRGSNKLFNIGGDITPQSALTALKAIIVEQSKDQADNFWMYQISLDATKLSSPLDQEKFKNSPLLKSLCG